jgi:hypothetical protein
MGPVTESLNGHIRVLVPYTHYRKENSLLVRSFDLLILWVLCENIREGLLEIVVFMPHATQQFTFVSIESIPAVSIASQLHKIEEIL